MSTSMENKERERTIERNELAAVRSEANDLKIALQNAQLQKNPIIDPSNSSEEMKQKLEDAYIPLKRKIESLEAEEKKGKE